MTEPVDCQSGRKPLTLGSFLKVSRRASRCPTGTKPPFSTPPSLESLRCEALTRHPPASSLLSVPLVRDAFTDLSFGFFPRCVDAEWCYQDQLIISTPGFNPIFNGFFYPVRSRFSTWLADPFTTARSLNDRDHLVREVLTMAHDYLHAWSYRIMDQLVPELGLLRGVINEENFEDIAFCHLLSEAVASVGLDYWQLCCRGANSYCDLGSCVEALTTSYRQRYLPEYRRACPILDVQQPAFLGAMTRFYCTGEFPFFEAYDLLRSARLTEWLEHELKYGQDQRRNTREWLAYRGLITLRGRTDGPVSPDTSRRVFLIDQMEDLLWDKVKHSRSPELSPAANGEVALPPRDPADLDFRFTNLAALTEPAWNKIGRPPDNWHFTFFHAQYISQIPFASFPDDRRKYIRLMHDQRDLVLMANLTRDLPRLDRESEEPVDLMILN
jgi:hypothetical protein